MFYHLFHIHSEETGVLFSLLLCSLCWLQLIGYVMGCGSYLSVCCYTISLSSLCKLIWRHWTYKMPVRYILSSVSKIKHILIVILYAIYMGLCVFSWAIFCVMIVRTSTLYLIIIIKWKVWTIIHCWTIIPLCDLELWSWPWTFKVICDIAVSQEWEGWLTWNKRDGSR